MIALLFMAAAYEVNRKQIARHVRADQTGKEDSYREIFRVLFLIVTPIIFSSIISTVISTVSCIQNWQAGKG